MFNVHTFQFSHGKIWKLINMLCVMSAVISVFLDNVTTILLMTPITIRLFECLNLNPVPIIPFIILNVNIAGLTTLIGHPPNLLIVNNDYILKHNITFLTYALHMSIGVMTALIQTNIGLFLCHKNIEEVLSKWSDHIDVLQYWRNCLQSVEQNPELNNLNRILTHQVELLDRFVEHTEPYELKLKKLKKTVSIMV